MVVCVCVLWVCGGVCELQTTRKLEKEGVRGHVHHGCEYCTARDVHTLHLLAHSNTPGSSSSTTYHQIGVHVYIFVYTCVHASISV